jgi:hypothetical protein
VHLFLRCLSRQEEEKQVLAKLMARKEQLNLQERQYLEEVEAAQQEKEKIKKRERDHR